MTKIYRFGNSVEVNERSMVDIFIADVKCPHCDKAGVSRTGHDFDYQMICNKNCGFKSPWIPECFYIRIKTV